LWITNLNRTKLTLPRKTTVAFASLCAEGANVMLLSEDDGSVETKSTQNEKKDFPVKLGEDLTLSEKTEILKVIDEFSNVFVTKESEMGKTKI